jgi:hypothetical protein
LRATRIRAPQQRHPADSLSRSGTDCFRQRKNGKCADTEGASTAGISFLLALLLGGAAFLFKQAAGENAVGAAWGGNVCSTSQMLCHHPEYLACVAAVMLVLAIIARLIGAVS